LPLELFALFPPAFDPELAVALLPPAFELPLELLALFPPAFDPELAVALLPPAFELPLELLALFPPAFDPELAVALLPPALELLALVPPAFDPELAVALLPPAFEFPLELLALFPPAFDPELAVVLLPPALELLLVPVAAAIGLAVATATAWSAPDEDEAATARLVPLWPETSPPVRFESEAEGSSTALIEVTAAEVPVAAAFGETAATTAVDADDVATTAPADVSVVLETCALTLPPAPPRAGFALDLIVRVTLP